MRNLSIAFLAAVSIASFGCKKKGDTGEAKPAGDSPKPTEPAKPVEPAKPAEPVAAGGEGCPAGATASPDKNFCVTLPAGQKGSEPYDSGSSSRRYDYSDEAGTGITIVVTKLDEEDDWDYELKSMSEEGQKKKEPKEEALPSGAKFYSYVDDDGSNWVTVLARKDKDMKYVFCRTNGKPAAPALIDACKSISPL